MKLSIIIPVYNVEKYLRKCLDSVICPGAGDYEVIVVNDGSTDSSPGIAQEYAAKYPTLIKLISTPNGGLGHARNTGISAASGSFIMFLDSDDSLAENALPEIFETLELDFDICIFDFVTVDERGRQLKYTSGCTHSGTFSLSDYPQLLSDPPNACNKIWRHSLFTDSGIVFQDRMWFEDLCTVPKLYLHTEKIYAAPRPWYVYLMRPGSITNSKSIERNLEMLTAVDSLLDYYTAMGQYDRYRAELEYMTAFHELICSTVRVNLQDMNSPVQDRLLEYFLARFPDYRRNPRIKGMSAKYRLLLFLIIHKHRRALNLIMRLNYIVKGKQT